MPVKSQAQRRLMYAAAEGKVPGIKKSVGSEFVNASHGITGLPEHVGGHDTPGAHYMSVAKRPHVHPPVPNMAARAKRMGGNV